MEEGSGLRGKVALVTGGSRGIGRAIALRLALAGAKVAVNYHTHAREADETVRAVQQGEGLAVAVQADVARGTDVKRMVETVTNALGNVDILVNNAGVIKDSLLVRMSEEEWDTVVNVDLKGAYLCTRAVLRPMLRSRWGRIINIGSVVGISGNVGQANYAAAKAGLIGFTKSVAKEVASRNITINCITPGYVTTDIVETLSPALKEKILSFIPMKRFGNPEEIATLALFLASPSSAYITGQTISIDGGLVLG